MSWNVSCSLEVDTTSSHVPKFIIIFAQWSRPNLQRDQHALASIRGQLRRWMHTDAINCHQAAFYQHLQTPLYTYGSPLMKGEVIAGSRPNPTEAFRSGKKLELQCYIYIIIINHIQHDKHVWGHGWLWLPVMGGRTIQQHRLTESSLFHSCLGTSSRIVRTCEENLQSKQNYSGAASRRQQQTQTICAPHRSGIAATSHGPLPCVAAISPHVGDRQVLALSNVAKKLETQGISRNDMLVQQEHGENKKNTRKHRELECNHNEITMNRQFEAESGSRIPTWSQVLYSQVDFTQGQLEQQIANNGLGTLPKRRCRCDAAESLGTRNP